MDQEKAVMSRFSQSEHVECMRFLLEMIPPEDADLVVSERKRIILCMQFGNSC
jgi:hypothetical protein